MAIEKGLVLTEEGVFKNGSVEFGETILKVETLDEDNAECAYIIPGLIDIHTHGSMGFDFSEASPEQMREMSLYYAKNGVTSFLATTITAPEDAIAGAMNNAALFERPEGGARCLGVNMEGPFLSYEKRGVHRHEYLAAPDIVMFEKMNALSNNGIRLVSIAPELPGAMEFIRVASKACKVSIAHSAAGYDIAMRAFENGATHVTHLFNATSPFSHREPGVVGAAADARAFVEIICDGVHLHPAVIRAIYKLFPGRVCMISDSVQSAGLPDGNYELGGLPIIVKDGKSTLEDGTIAGSVISLIQGVRFAAGCGLSLGDVVTAATLNNARSVGLEESVGSLTPGKKADVVILDRELNVRKVYIDGREA